MPNDTRKRNLNWTIGENTYVAAQLAVLMDIREELQGLNRLLHCSNFIRIPRHIDAIRKNTTKKKRNPKL